MNFLNKIIALAASVSAILFFMRFAAPKVHMCTISGKGAQTVTICGNMIRFNGDDIMSIYRVSLVNTPWRSK
jgi:hypothetical protein